MLIVITILYSSVGLKSKMEVSPGLVPSESCEGASVPFFSPSS